ncbi:hypothetical protein KAZ57_00155 [Patescibacteria group bacterium]|nr:hypothetical protein [Patescibacteria group bacterium]
MKTKLISAIVAATAVLLTAGVTYAAFSDTGKVLGSSFSVGSADLKLLKDPAGGLINENLADEMAGPAFMNIGPNWKKDYAIKIYNNATGKVQIATNANYLTTNDPDDLRSVIYVEPVLWSDGNNNGVVDAGEESTSFGKKTITKWKTEGFDLGQVDSGSVKGLVLRFSTDSLSDTKQGKSGIFDFEFDSITVE